MFLICNSFCREMANALIQWINNSQIIWHYFYYIYLLYFSIVYKDWQYETINDNGRLYARGLIEGTKWESEVVRYWKGRGYVWYSHFSLSSLGRSGRPIWKLSIWKTWMENTSGDIKKSLFFQYFRIILCISFNFKYKRCCDFHKEFHCFNFLHFPLNLIRVTIMILTHIF